MGTAATATLVCGPNNVGDHKEWIFSVALETTGTSGAVGAQTVDLTDWVAYAYAGWVADVDTLADNANKYGVVLPTKTTAITSTNVIISAHGIPALDGGSANAASLAAWDGKDLTAVGALKIIIRGRGLDD